ncbi:hypothetical protein IIZ77_00295 [Candidatus Saccharibacteria bacterium]|nr:hypothetical protein [Candidatus Saccharibacteria bacterium]
MAKELRVVLTRATPKHSIRFTFPDEKNWADACMRLAHHAEIVKDKEASDKSVWNYDEGNFRNMFLGTSNLQLYEFPTDRDSGKVFVFQDREIRSMKATVILKAVIEEEKHEFVIKEE